MSGSHKRDIVWNSSAVPPRARLGAKFLGWGQAYHFGDRLLCKGRCGSALPAWELISHSLGDFLGWRRSFLTLKLWSESLISRQLTYSILAKVDGHLPSYIQLTFSSLLIIHLSWGPTASGFIHPQLPKDLLPDSSLFIQERQPYFAIWEKGGRRPSWSWPILCGSHGWHERSWSHSIGSLRVPSRMTWSFVVVFKFDNSLSIDCPENYLDEFCIIIIYEKDTVAFAGNCIGQRIMCWGRKRICEYLKSPRWFSCFS